MLVTGSQKSTVLKGTTFVDTLLGWGVRQNSDGSVTEDITKVAHESMFGNSGDDKLYGGAGNDTLYGEVGDDMLSGGSGLDKLYGGSGNDSLKGGVGNDLLDGGIGADLLYGEEGDDQLCGGDGNDLLNGDTIDSYPIDNYPIEAKVLFKPLYVGGNDILYGGAGDDIINGDGGNYQSEVRPFFVQQEIVGGNDKLYGGTGNDTLNGEGGNDSLYGEGGNDRLNGGSGDDLLSGGDGNNYLTGGEGADTFVATTGFDIISDFSPASVQTEVLIDFESSFPNGLSWSNVTPTGGREGLSGYINVINSPNNSSFNGSAYPGSFSNPSQDFNLDSGYFAAAWNNDLLVTVIAYDDGNEVGRATIQMDPNKVLVDFTARTATGADSSSFSGTFDSIDRVVYVGTGGTDAGLDGGGEHVAVDDLTISYGTPGEGDLIDLPAVVNIDTMIVGATSDGNGGTTLNTGLGIIDLVGIEPSTLSADWFV